MWEEIGPKWPEAFWDDWLREPPQRRGRHCLRPEISRS
jgi:alpha-1,3-mannosyl-glycoprotein beta-1,2-N-acetylglucosaminyltransferase